MKRRNSTQRMNEIIIITFYIAKNTPKIQKISYSKLNTELRSKFCHGYVPDVLIGREKYYEVLLKHLEQTIENKQNNRYKYS